MYFWKITLLCYTRVLVELVSFAKLQKQRHCLCYDFGQRGWETLGEKTPEDLHMSLRVIICGTLEQHVLFFL